VKRIAFRADGNPQIGLGHLYRCFALNDMIKDTYQTAFITAPGSISLASLNPGIQAQTSDDETFLNSLDQYDMIVLDGYHFSSEYQRTIKQGKAKLIVIDDLHDRHMYADAVINTAAGVKQTYYDAEPYTTFYLGADYALIRGAFLDSNNSSGTHSRSGITICLGGSDVHNLTCKIISALPDPGTEKINVVIGAGYRHEAQLNSLQDQVPFTLYKNLDAGQLSALYRTSRISIVSASVSAYEALACGTRVICGYYADNQTDMYHGLVEQNAILPLGKLTDEAIGGISSLLVSQQTLNDHLIDGRSPARIKKLIDELAN
jgi:UDP-2,4-diacetamido-2,4,6-trideoxy-beta-L-altropyranose hydrolase